MTGVASPRVDLFELEELQSTQRNTLIIGSLERWRAEGRLTEDLGEFAFVELSALTEEIFNELNPTIVLSPLLGDSFDASDVAVALTRFGYEGRYRVISGMLPNDNLIRDEIRELAPELDFDLLMVPFDGDPS